MAFALPTSPATSPLTYDELDDHYEDVTGTSAGLISTVVGQRLAAAAQQAYWEMVSCMLRWGLTPAQITSWFAAEGHAFHRYLAAYWWLSNSGVSRDHAVFADAARYREQWDTLCAQGGPWFNSSGVLLEADPELAGDAMQARATVQNNSAGERHAFRFDADPRQFLSGNASTIAGGARYPNPRGC